MEEQIETLFLELVQSTNFSNSIPKPEADGGDYEFYSTDATFRTRMQATGKSLLSLLNTVLDAQSHPSVSPANRKSGQSSLQIYNADDLTDKFGDVVDVLDSVLEKVVSKTVASSNTKLVVL